MCNSARQYFLEVSWMGTRGALDLQTITTRDQPATGAGAVYTIMWTPRQCRDRCRDRRRDARVDAKISFLSAECVLSLAALLNKSARGSHHLHLVAQTPRRRLVCGADKHAYGVGVGGLRAAANEDGNGRVEHDNNGSKEGGWQRLVPFSWLFRSAPSTQIEYEHALEVTGLKKSYTRRPKRKGKRENRAKATIINAVENLSLTADTGQIVGLLGPNASGKTTTLRCIATLVPPTEGQVRIFGIDALRKGRMARQMLGYVHQDAGLDKVLTGREHLELFSNLAHLDRATRERNIELLVELLGLTEFVDLQTGVYSGGIKRRLDIALALLHQPGLLLLDEPTTGLDVDSREAIWNLLRVYRDRGACILLTSHYLEEVEQLADQVAIVDRGGIIAQGSPRELKSSLGGRRMQIRLKEFASVQSAETALQFLRSQKMIREGLLNAGTGNSLELVVEGDVSVTALVEALRQAGFDNVFSYSQSQMSLGDVFLNATGRTLTDADMISKLARDPKEMKRESMQ